MGHPQKCRTGSTQRPAVPRTRAPLTAPGPKLGPMLADAVRLMGRTVRGVASAAGWRRKDILSGQIHPAYSLELMILSAHDEGAPIEDVLPCAAALEQFIRQVYGEAPTLALVDAFEAETEAQGRADVAQLRVIAGGGQGALMEAREKLHAHRVAVDRAFRAVSHRLEMVQ